MRKKRKIKRKRNLTKKVNGRMWLTREAIQDLNELGRRKTRRTNSRENSRRKIRSKEISLRKEEDRRSRRMIRRRKSNLITIYATSQFLTHHPNLCKIGSISMIQLLLL